MMAMFLLRFGNVNSVKKCELQLSGAANAICGQKAELAPPYLQPIGGS
jgi:hypothetical protein